MSNAEIFPWSKFFEVGVEEIDTQHKKLVKIINDICSCVLSTKNFEETVEKLFARLINYSTYHFESEERYFEINFLPEDLLQGHKKSHAELISQVLALKSKYDSGSNKNASLEEILTTLVVWLTGHILDDDMRMCLIASNIEKGLDFAEAERLANEEMEGSRGTVVRVMSSMMHVSSASVLELRREIDFRRQLEDQLNSEISFRKDAEEKLKQLAQHDPLTGLANRRLFQELCSANLTLAKRNKSKQAILFIDIDGFKGINDTLGHKAGDALLVSVAQRLEESVRDSDVVARMGGDEFTVHLVGDCNEDAARIIAAKIIAALSEPFELEEGTPSVSASIGISMFPDDAENVTELVKNADSAMYAAKQSGKNGFKFYNQDQAEQPK